MGGCNCAIEKPGSGEDVSRIVDAVVDDDPVAFKVFNAVQTQSSQGRSVASVQPQEPTCDSAIPASGSRTEAPCSTHVKPPSVKKLKAKASIMDSFEASADRSTMCGSFEAALEISDDESSAGSDCPDYGNPDFWKEVYGGTSKHKVPAEWLLSYNHFKTLKWHRYLRGGNILEIGCGNSSFMSDAYDDGFRDITCTDVDRHLIKIMREQNALTRPDIRYLQADACDMRAFGDGSFKIIFDKSTMDALLCSGPRLASRCSAEVHRVLADDGLYVCVSFGHPDQTKHAIERTGCPSRRWKIQVLKGVSEDHDESEDGPEDRYMYVCSKEQIAQRMGKTSKRMPR